ncbi:MAG: hypothetical protein L7S59_03740, partial [Pseudomonadales bacterium]|nr:hypothetical protein [Pseudomonadales bacterium]
MPLQITTFTLLIRRAPSKALFCTAASLACAGLMGFTPMDVLAKSVVAQTESQHSQTVWHCTDEHDGKALTRICQPETSDPKIEPAVPVPVATAETPASYPPNDPPIIAAELIVPAPSDSAK